MRPSLEVAKERFKKTSANYDKVIGVEIGVLSGWNARTMLSEIENLAILHLVDPYTGYYPHYYTDAKKYLEKHTNRIVWHIITSERAVNLFDEKTVDFVYIDNGHTYDLVERDVNRWWPIIKAGGMICGHDYVAPGDVKSAVDAFVSSRKFKLYTGEDSDWWILK